MNSLCHQTLLNDLPLGLCLLDCQYRVLFWNHYFARQTGLSAEQVMGQSLLELFAPQARFLKKKIDSVVLLSSPAFSSWEHQPHVFEMTSSRPVTGAETLMYQNIEFLPILNDRHETSQVCLILQDVTELASYILQERALKAELAAEHARLLELNSKLEKAQNQLLQSEKMAAIGQLAAGVAHEINNPMGFISSNLQTLTDYSAKLFQLIDFYENLVSKSGNAALQAQQQATNQRLQVDFIRSDLPELLTETLEGATRVADIVGNLKTFSHVDNAQWQPYNVLDCLESTIRISMTQFKHKVELHRDYPAALPLIDCQPMQLNQVFLNLLVNAGQAIAERGDIWLRVSTADDGVLVSVRDNGSGISAEHQKRLFEPFFTTKAVGQGTGLGLSLSWSIVEKHHGRIEFSSVPAQGTEFRVWLPFHQPAIVDAPA